MEIIGKGKKRVFKCIHCECVFKTVEYEKINSAFEGRYFIVRCPECLNSFGVKEYKPLDK